MNNFTVALAIAALGAGGAALAGQASQPGKGWGEPGPVTRAQAQESAGQMFDRLDANKDGKIDASDRDARRTAHRTAMFERLDANHDGQVSREEFVNARMERPMGGGPGGGGAGHQGHGAGMGGHDMGGPGMGMRGHARGMHRMGGMMVRMADANKDGAVTRDEFNTAFLQHFDQVDTNKDGTITPEERRAGHAAMRERMHGQMGGHGGMHGHGMGAPGGAATPPKTN